MDQHFHLSEPEQHSAYVTKQGERLGTIAVGIVAIGVAIAVALALVALGISLVRWAA